jgi:hypothetical protein
MTFSSGILRPLVLAVLALALSGCGTLFGKSEPSRGDRMIAQGEAVADLGKMWNEGSKLVDRADSLAAEGARLKRRGQQNVQKGQAQVQRARVVVEEQQREYARFAESLGPMATLETAREQRNRLDKVVNEWRGGWEKLKAGRKLAEKGRSQIAEGEAKLAEAGALRYRGHAMMQKAEAKYSSGGTVPAAAVSEE